MRNLILPCLLLAVGCSSDDSPQTPSSFCESWAEAACSEQTRSACQAADANQCQASQISFCLTKIPAEGFSGTKSDQCIDAVRSAYSDADLTASELRTVLLLEAPCDQLVTGPKDKGESCTSRLDCDAPEGYDCVFKGDSPTGTCQVPKQVGAGLDCSAVEAVCAEGFYCNGDNCIGGEDIGDPCASDEQCGTDGYCTAAGLCAERLPVESTCTLDEQCESGLCYEFPTGRVCTDRLRLSRSEPICNDLR